MTMEPAASLHERALTLTDALAQVPPASGSAKAKLGVNPGLNTMIECAKLLTSGLTTSRSTRGRALPTPMHTTGTAHAK